MLLKYLKDEYTNGIKKENKQYIIAIIDYVYNNRTYNGEILDTLTKLTNFSPLGIMRDLDELIYNN